jgi:signal transduction histidine kinase
MSSNPNKWHKKIGPRLTILFSLTLIISLFTVSGIIYTLLSTSLRKTDKELIKSRTRDYIHAYQDSGVTGLHHFIEDQRRTDDGMEMFVSLSRSNGEEVFTYMPDHLDRDAEDAEELLQIKLDVQRMELTEGWHIVLLLSGEEEDNLLEKWEWKLRQFVAAKKWMSLLPLIDNDNVEIFFTQIDQDLWIKVGKSSEDREEHLAQIRKISFFVLFPFIFIGFLISALLSRSVLRPIQGLISTITAIEEGSRGSRAEISGSHDEIDQLSLKFNALMESNQNLIQGMKNILDNVAHDLRTPMTRFRMGAERALGKKSENEELVEALSDGVETSEKIMSMLSAILDVSEAETGTMVLHPEEIDVDQFLEQMLDLYQFVAEEKNIGLRAVGEKDLCVLADRIRLGQAVGNLIDNAIKYSGPGTQVTLEVEEARTQVILKIRDQGIGMAPEELSRIWDRLYRVDHSRSTPGLGIGLSVVKAIVQAHQGEVGVESSVGLGTSFTLTLPKCNGSERVG